MIFLFAGFESLPILHPQGPSGGKHTATTISAHCYRYPIVVVHDGVSSHTGVRGKVYELRSLLCCPLDAKVGIWVASQSFEANRIVKSAN